MEQQVGIEEYTTSTTGFTGILKHRYNDFQVFEVDLSGRTAHLTSTDAPCQAASGSAAAAAASLTDESILEAVAAFAAIAGDANAAQLKKLLSNIMQQQQAAAGSAQQQQQPEAEPKALELEIDLLPEQNKDTRKAIHQFLKSDPRLPQLQTDTVAAEAAAGAAAADAQAVHNIIRIRPAAGGGQGRQRGGQDKRGQKRGKREWRTEPSWEGGSLHYVKFVMLKENMDSQAALGVIARMLALQPRNFGFAGTKDKRGITTQYVTVWKTQPARLAALNPRLRGVKLGNFEYAGSHLSLGQLRGNTFRLLMRDVRPHDEQHIASAVSEVREKGFINYFGLQRFGTGAVPTHKIGSCLLRGEWQAAVQLIMQGAPEEREEFKQGRALYTDKGDIQGALKALPTFLVAERALLQSMARSGCTAYLSGLQAIPRTLRSMYMHAWQSWVWNRAASERIRRYGASKVVPGDLVLLSKDQQQQGDQAGQATAAAASASSGKDDAAAAVAGDVAMLYDEEKAADAEGEQADEDEVAAASASSRLGSVHVVTEAEAAEGRFSIQDVVMPLPGGRVQYPKHEAGWQLYCRLAAADGVLLPGMTAEEYVAAVQAAAAAAAGGDGTGGSGGGGGGDSSSGKSAEPAMHSVREFQLSCLSGDYRKLLHVPSDMQHRVVKYSHPDQDDMLPSDWNELQQQGGRQQKRQKLEQQPEQQLEQQQEHQQEQQQQQSGPGQKQHVAAGEPAAAGGADAAASAGGSREMVGVVLEFTLPSSCYATMLVRELTKSSTSKASHKELSTRA